MTPSLSFDRAADFYDQTRAIPRDVVLAVRQTLLDEIGSRPDPRLLEVGVGTGRIAWPFLEAGDFYVGVDLSRQMMARLQTRYPTARIAQADMTRLPFPDDFFDAALAVHVFHLVGGWQRGLDDVRRVLKSNGILAWSWHWRDDQSLNRRVRRWLSAEVEKRGYSTQRPGAQSDKVRAELERRGADMHIVEVAHWAAGTTTLRHELNRLANRITSDTWALPDDVLDASLAEVEEQALSEYGSLDYAESIDGRFLLCITRWPAA